MTTQRINCGRAYESNFPTPMLQLEFLEEKKEIRKKKEMMMMMMMTKKGGGGEKKKKEIRHSGEGES